MVFSSFFVCLPGRVQMIFQASSHSPCSPAKLLNPDLEWWVSRQAPPLDFDSPRDKHGFFRIHMWKLMGFFVREHEHWSNVYIYTHVEDIIIEVTLMYIILWICTVFIYKHGLASGVIKHGWDIPELRAHLLVVFRTTPLKNDGVNVSWDDYSQYMEK